MPFVSRLPLQSLLVVPLCGLLFSAGWFLTAITLHYTRPLFHHLASALLTTLALLLLSLVSRSCITGQNLLFGESVMAPRVLLLTFTCLSLFGAVWSAVVFFLWGRTNPDFDDYAAPIGVGLISISSLLVKFGRAKASDGENFF